ncbi:MAG: RNA polymerase sigma factor [Bacteroidota bacterium]|nr:RNA polymerase sigma factor [Bacteroidota bacterium]MDP4232978.1 RNA polymerase sigma factor [Bacteroidota bacterium]MDP4242022.1 RNA polymerase sigma factor [Bacteroidota bacterium]MDP4286925.1 RNA polymerase sigma factor [Bacteroidota bacterium]
MKRSSQRTDQELANDLRGSRREAEAAFSELYGRYAQRTYALLLRMTGDTAASQDLLQEVFLKFYSAASQDLLVTNPGGFILRVARNLCLNWKRDTKAPLSLDDLELAAATDERLERDDLLHILNLALELLEFEYREAFVLKFYQGYSYEEMSTLTGESIDALRNRVWRAKEQVRHVLRPYIHDLVKHS